MSLTLRVHAVEGAPSTDDLWAKANLAVLARSDLSDPEKTVLTVLTSPLLTTTPGVCQASNKRIGQACGKDDETVARLLRGLERKGLLERRYGSSERVLYLNIRFATAGGRPTVAPVGTTADPGSSAGVNNCQTPADAPSAPGASAGGSGRGRRVDPAPAPPILRLSRELDPDGDGRSASAGQGQAPPPPTVQEEEPDPSEPGQWIELSAVPLPDRSEVPPEIARFLPVTIPPGTQATIGRRISRAPGSKFFPLPLSTADILNHADHAQAVALTKLLDKQSTGYQIVSIALCRHNRAVMERLKGVVLPPGENVRDVARTIDVEPQSVEVEPRETREKSGPLVPVEDANRPLGVPQS